MIVNEAEVLDQGDVKAVCGDLETQAKLEVKKKEEKPKVETDDQESDDAKMRGKYKGKRFLFYFKLVSMEFNFNF